MSRLSIVKVTEDDSLTISETLPRRLRKRSLIAPSLHEDIGEQLVLNLYNAYKTRFGVYIAFNSSNAPQNLNMPGVIIHKQDSYQADLTKESILPERTEDRKVLSIDTIIRGSLKHLVWLFFATLTDRRQVSMEVYKSHVMIHKNHPEMYTRDVLKMRKEELGRILSRHRVGCPNQSADYWIKCARTLFGEFGGNPLKLLKCCGSSVEGIVEFKRREKTKKGRGYDPLPGYGPKIASLYTLFLAELRKIKMPEDSFPVDVHVQRLFIQNKAIVNQTDTYNEELEDILRVFICKVSKKHSLDKVALSHAFWQLGRTLCNGCYRVKGIESLCPVYNQCLGSIETKDYYKVGTWPSQEASIFAKKGLRTFKLGPADDINLHLFDE